MTRNGPFHTFFGSHVPIVSNPVRYPAQGIPLNLAIDHFFRHVEVTGMKAGGAGLVILGFAILAVPAQRR